MLVGMVSSGTVHWVPTLGNVPSDTPTAYRSPRDFNEELGIESIVDISIGEMLDELQMLPVPEATVAVHGLQIVEGLDTEMPMDITEESQAPAYQLDLASSDYQAGQIGCYSSGTPTGTPGHLSPVSTADNQLLDGSSRAPGEGRWDTLASPHQGRPIRGNSV